PSPPGKPTRAARITAVPTPSSTCSPGSSPTRPCPKPTGSGPPSTSPCPSARCSAATTNPPTSTATGPSPPPTPAASPATRPVPAGGWSPTTPPNPLDSPRNTYRPPANLTNDVIARDKTCTFAGCPRPARQCDLDHGEAWREGGETNSDKRRGALRQT